MWFDVAISSINYSVKILEAVGVTSEKAIFFIVTAVKTSNLTFRRNG
jgi:hypothetical protein